MNDAAAGALRNAAWAAWAAGDALAARPLAPGLRALLDLGVVRSGEVLVFARNADQVGRAPGDFPDLTGWECSVNSFHLEDVLPVRVGRLDDGEPVISDADQLLMLRHGLGFALELVGLVNSAADPDPDPVAVAVAVANPVPKPVQVPVRCIISVNRTSGTFRFHRARSGESWLAADLDAYRQEMLIAVDSDPSPGRLHPP